MSWWRNLFKSKRNSTRSGYGLFPDNPILCGGGVDGEFDYLQRLRCPAGMPIRFQRRGSLERTSVDYLNGKDVNLSVSPGTRRRMGDDPDPQQMPLDAYLIVCDCGDHQEEIFVDMYFRGPERPIGDSGWTVTTGVAPVEHFNEKADCPYCGEELRTPAAKQCRVCKMDWHDPENVFRRETKAN